MAVMIGKGKSWAWWLAGFLCALVFGARAGAAEEGPRAVALYGIRPGPGGVDAPAVNPEQQKKAEGLVADYLAPVAAVEPTPEARAAIEKLVKDLGSNDAKTREEASAAVVLEVLAGRPGPARDIVLLNAAAALAVAGLANGIAAALPAAAASIDSGAARAALDKLVEVSNA